MERKTPKQLIEDMADKGGPSFETAYWLCVFKENINRRNRELKG